MSLNIKCDRCHKEIEQLSALVFSPPDEDGNCKKIHLCVDPCFEELCANFMGNVKYVAGYRRK